jgi:hypothetical protein
MESMLRITPASYLPETCPATRLLFSSAWLFVFSFQRMKKSE